MVYENEGDESPDWVAGDLVVVVLEKEAELGEAEGRGWTGPFSGGRAGSCSGRRC